MCKAWHGLRALRRCGVSLPIKYCLCPGCQSRRHKTQFKKRLDIQLLVGIHNKVKICKIILSSVISLRVLIFVIYSHIIRKKSMSPDMRKAYLLLNQLKLIKVLSLQGKSHPPCPNTVINIIVEAYLVILINSNTFCHHSQPSFTS